MTEDRAAVLDCAVRARDAAYVLRTLTRAEKDQALHALADALCAGEDLILAANARDVERAVANGTSAGLVDRLTLTSQRLSAIAEALLKKDGNALRATKWAVRRMIDMTYENAEDYLIRAQEALHSYGGVAARKEATRQFLDEKSFKPGLGTFDATKVQG